MRAVSVRYICAASAPAVLPPLVETIAFDLTCLATVQAKRQSASSRAVGARLVTTFRSASATRQLSRDWTRIPPALVFIISPPRAGSGRSRSEEQTSELQSTRRYLYDVF